MKKIILVAVSIALLLTGCGQYNNSTEAYEIGYEEGYTDGFREGQQSTEIYQSGYDTGYEDAEQYHSTRSRGSSSDSDYDYDDEGLSDSEWESAKDRMMSEGVTPEEAGLTEEDLEGYE
jgi:hypothetical protein